MDTNEIVIPVFPEDFIQVPHDLSPLPQYIYPATNDVIISIIGGGRGQKGDGINTFEMYDFREFGDVGYMTVEEINNHLISNPIIKR